MTRTTTIKTYVSRFQILILCSVLLISLIITTLTTTTAGAVTGSIGGRPANPRDDNKRTRSIFVHTLNFGQSAKEGLLVVNNSDTKQTVNLYAVDGTVTSSGSLTCRQRVEDKKDVGSWVSLSESSVTLEPGADQIVDFTIQVPNEKVDVGEHNGCMVIEPLVDDGTEGDSGGVRIRTRSAIRVAVTIPGELKKELSFSNFVVRPEKGNFNYDVSVENKGNVSLDTDIEIKMSTLFGDVVYTNGGQYPVIPRATLDLTFTDEKPPMFGGWYWVDANVKYDSAISNGIGEITDQNNVTKTWERQLVFVAPTANGLLTILGIIVLVGSVPVYLTYQIIRRKQTLSKGEQHVVNDGETLRSIAELHETSWKKLASLNKVKPPYEVQAGSTLVIPKKNKPKRKSNQSKKV